MSDNNNNNNNQDHEDNASANPKANIQQLFQQRNQQAQQNSKIVTGDDGEKRSLFKDYTDKATIYFKRNKNSMYHIDRDCTKVLIEGCSNCRIVFNARVKTEVVEIWKCDNLEIIVNKASIKTLQVDICSDLNITFKDRNQFQEMIWAGVKNFTLNIGSSSLSSGLDDVLNLEQYANANISPDTDQFIIRFVDGVLLQELIVRLENGFPTTDREADDFAARQKRNDEKFENFIRSLLTEKNNTVAGDLQELNKLKEEREHRGNEENANDGEQKPQNDEEKKEEPAEEKKEEAEN